MVSILGKALLFVKAMERELALGFEAMGGEEHVRRGEWKDVYCLDTLQGHQVMFGPAFLAFFRRVSLCNLCLRGAPSHWEGRVFHLLI